MQDECSLRKKIVDKFVCTSRTRRTQIELSNEEFRYQKRLIFVNK